MDAQQIIALGLVALSVFFLGLHYARKRRSPLKRDCDACACGPGEEKNRSDRRSRTGPTTIHKQQ